jgi:hypothetical protein
MAIEPISATKVLAQVQSGFEDCGEKCSEQIVNLVEVLTDAINERFAALERKITRRN